MLSNFRNKRVLLLQGPLGPFFKRFAKDLIQNDATVTKVNFCGGDTFFFHGKNVVKYRDTLYNWPQYLKELKAVLLFQYRYNRNHFSIAGIFRHQFFDYNLLLSDTQYSRFFSQNLSCSIESRLNFFLRKDAPVLLAETSGSPHKVV